MQRTKNATIAMIGTSNQQIVIFLVVYRVALNEIVKKKKQGFTERYEIQTRSTRHTKRLCASNIIHQNDEAASEFRDTEINQILPACVGSMSLFNPCTHQNRTKFGADQRTPPRVSHPTTGVKINVRPPSISPNHWCEETRRICSVRVQQQPINQDERLWVQTTPHSQT